MPYHVDKTDACPTNKPWGVINKDTGATGGRCHATKEKAVRQMTALQIKEGLVPGVKPKKK